MSDTPKTDAHIKEMGPVIAGVFVGSTVHPDFARDLERALARSGIELATATERVKEQFQLYCEETKKHNATAGELTRVKADLELAAKGLEAHAVAVGVSVDHADYINQTTATIADLTSRLATAEKALGEAKRDRHEDLVDAHHVISDNEQWRRTEHASLTARAESAESALTTTQQQLAEAMEALDGVLKYVDYAEQTAEFGFYSIAIEKAKAIRAAAQPVATPAQGKSL